MARPFGSVNRNKTEAAKFAKAIVEDPEYCEQFRKRAINGTLPPAVECLVWYYAFGRPVEQLMLSAHRSDGDDLSGLTNEELALRAEGLVRLLRGGKDDDGDTH